MRIDFDTWGDFISQINDETLPRWQNDSVTGRKSFTGTDTFAAALTLAIEGWPEGRSRMSDALAVVAPKRGHRAPSLHYDVAGERPDINRAIAGDPACMLTTRREASTRCPIVRIDYNACANANVDTECFFNRGAALLTMVDGLENAGFSTELRIVFRTRGGGYGLDATVVFKRAGEPLDIDRAAFALTHPSTLRRFIFRLIEQTPSASRLGSSYGHNYDFALADLADEQGVYISSPSYEDTDPHNSFASVKRQLAGFLDSDD